MAAVIGLDAEKITQTLKEIGADQVDLANFNSPRRGCHIWPRCPDRDYPWPTQGCWCRMVVPLKVSGAFHSRMMEEPAREFGEFLKDFAFSSSIPGLLQCRGKAVFRWR